MSAPTSTETAPVTIDTDRPGIPFVRLAQVEVRKMIDTRAGLWLMIITGGLLLVTMAITLLVVGLVDEASVTAQGFGEIMTIPLSLLLPVFAIVTVTSEWGQRTHLSLFTLEPHRARVFAAKLVAVVVLALVTIALAIVLGAIGNVLGGAITGDDVVWNVDGSNLAWLVGLQLAYFLMAFALATALLSTPLSIIVFYAFALIVPFMVYSPLVAFFDWAQTLIPWIDMNFASAPLVAGTDFSGQPVDVGLIDYARFGVTLLLWVVLPATIGLNRVVRSEIK